MVSSSPNPWLLAAALALVAIAGVHTVMGERQIFRPWRRQPPQGARPHHLRLVRVSWHLPSLLGLGQAGALAVWAVQPPSAAATWVHPMVLCLAAGCAACGALVAFATRGRHHGGTALLLTAALIAAGA